MAAEAKIGIRPFLQDEEYKSAITQLTQFTVAQLGGVTKELAASQQKATTTLSQSAKNTAKVVAESMDSQAHAYWDANNALAKAEEKMQGLRKKYSKDAGKEIIDDMKKLQDQKAAVIHAMTLTTEKAAQDELKARKKEYDEELRLLKQVALDKKDVQSGGAGAKAGIMGTGRQVAGGVGNMLMGGAAVAAGATAFKFLAENAKLADDASDRTTIALTKAGLAGKALEDEQARMGKSATKMADDFAMPKHEIMGLQATIVGFGGITGKQLDQLTEISIGSANALGMNADAVAKLIAKGADPEQEAQLKKLGIEFPKTADAAERMRIVQEKLGSTIQATKDSTHDSIGAFDRIKNKLQDVAVGFADKAFTALQPVFEALMQIIEALMPVIDALMPILLELADMIGKNAAELAKALIPLLQALMPILLFLAKLISGILNLALTGLIWVVGQLANILAKALDWIVEVANKIKGLADGVMSFLGLVDKKEVKTTVKVEKKEETTAVTAPPVTPEKNEKSLAAQQKATESAAAKRARLEKQAYDAERTIAEEAHKDKLTDLELALAKDDITHETYNRRKLEEEISFNNAQVVLAQKHHQKDGAFQLASAKAQVDLRKAKAAEEVAIEQAKYDAVLDANQDAIARGDIDDAEAHRRELEAARVLAAAKVKIERESNGDVEKAKKDLAKVEKDIAREKAKEARDQAKELAKIKADAQQKELERMSDGIDKELKLEDLKYKIELDQLRESIKDKDALRIANETAEKEHQKRTAAIVTKYTDDQSGTYKKYGTGVLQMAEASGQERLQRSRDFMSQEVLGMEAGFLNQTGVVRRYLTQMLVSYVASKWAEVSVTSAAEAAKTGAQSAGIGARLLLTAKEVGANVVGAASSAFTAVANAIRWITTIIPFPFSLALIPAAIAGIYGMYTGARKLFKFKDGGITRGATAFQFGSGGQHAGLFGEDRSSAGEAFIPLEKLPGIVHQMNLLTGHAGVEALIPHLQQISAGVHAEKPPIVMDTYGTKLSIDQAMAVQAGRRI